MSGSMPPPAPERRAAADQGTALDRVAEPFRWPLRRLGLGLLFVLILMPALQVFLRGVLQHPFVGAEELARFMLICVVFITLPSVVSSGASIQMEELLCALPPRVQQVLRVGLSALAAAAFAVAAWSVGVATVRNLQNATPALGIPYWIFFSAAFLGLLFAAAESAVLCVKAVQGHPLYVRLAEELPPDEADLDQALSRPPSARGQP